VPRGLTIPRPYDIMYGLTLYEYDGQTILYTLPCNLWFWINYGAMQQPLVLSTSGMIPFIKFAQAVRFMVVESEWSSTLDRNASRSQPCSRDLVKRFPWSTYLSMVHTLITCPYLCSNTPTPTHLVVMGEWLQGFCSAFPYGGDHSVTWSSAPAHLVSSFMATLCFSMVSHLTM